MKKRLAALLLTMCMVIGMIPTAAASGVYADVDTGAWYAESVDYVTRNGLMNGTGEGLFSPNAYATRGAVMTILARTAGVDTTAGNVWYEAGLNWAVAGGVSDGSNPLDNITREQLATILYRYAAMLGCDMNYWQPLDIFADADKVSDYAVEALEWASALGLFKGTDGKLMPKATATRAQLAAVLERYCDDVLALDDAADDVAFGYWPGWWMIQDEQVDTWDGTATALSADDFATGEFMIYTAEELAGLSDYVDAGNTLEGIVVKLHTNLDLSGHQFDPIGDLKGNLPFKGTFDGQGHTIIGLSENGWEQGYNYGDSRGLGLFAYVEDSTIKNLNIDQSEIQMEAVVMGNVAGYAFGECTFENITVTNSQLANYNWDTGGIVGQLGGKATFKNISVDSSNTISGLWGTWDASLGGLVGRTTDNTEASFENCYVACKLDAFNDVCAAYQWYAYRYSGMLIGYTKVTKTESGRTTAIPGPNVTFKNVTVEYGDWANYTYCQPANVKPQFVREQGGFATDPYYSGRHWTAGVDANGEKMIDSNHAHNPGEEHQVLIPFDQLFGGGQGVYGTAAWDGVTVIY